MKQDTSVGFLLGAAYEIPDIALRLAASYRFETDHSAATTESMLGLSSVPGTVDYVTPQSFNLDFQTGVAKNTLLTANFRWTDFSAVDVVPTLLGSDLVTSTTPTDIQSVLRIAFLINLQEQFHCPTRKLAMQPQYRHLAQQMAFMA